MSPAPISPGLHSYPARPFDLGRAIYYAEASAPTDRRAGTRIAEIGNPVLAEALVALARRNATLIDGLYQAMMHAHERGGSSWEPEWTLLSEMASSTAAALAHPSRLAETLIVDGSRMEANVEALRGLVLAAACHGPRPRS